MLKASEMYPLPAIIYNLWRLWKGNFDVDQRFYCRVNGREMSAPEMFGRIGKAVFVKRDCLPYDADIKACSIGFGEKNRGRIAIETTILDWKKIIENVAEQGQRLKGLEVRGRKFFWGGNQLLATTSQQWFGAGLRSPRTLIQSPASLDEELLARVLLVAELIHEHCCFVEELRPKPEEDSVPPMPIVSTKRKKDPRAKGPEQRMEMQLGMDRLLETEQRPIMCMAHMQLARLIHHQQVLKMSQQQLATHVQQEASTNPFLAGVGKK